WQTSFWLPSMLSHCFMAASYWASVCSAMVLVALAAGAMAIISGVAAIAISCMSFLRFICFLVPVVVGCILGAAHDLVGFAWCLAFIHAAHTFVSAGVDRIHPAFAGSSGSDQIDRVAGAGPGQLAVGLDLDLA